MHKYMRGLYLHSREYRKSMFEELFLEYVFAPSQVCLLTIAPSVCMGTAVVFTHTHTPDANT